MKLSLLVAAFSAVFYTVSADAGSSSNTLMKRGSGFPFATLPSTTCTTPSTCSHIDQPVTCRCSNDLTTCQNSAGDYCWHTPLVSTSCTSVPSICSAAFIGTTPTCFCGSQTTLCVDNAGDYCYLDRTPNLAATSSTAAFGSATSSSAAANPTMDTAGSRSDANSSANANANANTNASTTASSGSEQISNKLWITAGCAVLAYAAIH